MLIKPPNGCAPQYRLSLYKGDQVTHKCGIPVKGVTMSIPDDYAAVVYTLLDPRRQPLSTYILTDDGWAVFTQERLEAKLTKSEPEPEPEPEPTEFDDDFLS